MKRSLAILTALLTALLLPAAGQARPKSITSGTIEINKGANGVELGMKRTEVVKKLGSPLYQNKFGYMQYSTNYNKGMFDIYLDYSKRPLRVRMMGIWGKEFMLSDGNYIFREAGLRRLCKAYGNTMRPERDDMGDFLYAIHGSLNGRKVSTDFFIERRSIKAPVMNIFILYRGNDFPKAKGIKACKQATTATHTSAGQTVNVTLSDFSIKLSKSKVKAGKVKFKIRNREGHHDFCIGKRCSDHLSTPGDTTTLTVRLKRGWHRSYCSEEDHEELGMVKRFKVV